MRERHERMGRIFLHENAERHGRLFRLLPADLHARDVEPGECGAARRLPRGPAQEFVFARVFLPRVDLIEPSKHDFEPCAIRVSPHEGLERPVRRVEAEQDRARLARGDRDRGEQAVGDIAWLIDDLLENGERRRGISLREQRAAEEELFPLRVARRFRRDAFEHRARALHFLHLDVEPGEPQTDGDVVWRVPGDVLQHAGRFGGTSECGERFGFSEPRGQRECHFVCAGLENRQRLDPATIVR